MLCRGAIWFDPFSRISHASCLKNDCLKIILRSWQPDVPICGGVGTGASTEYSSEIGCVLILKR